MARSVGPISAAGSTFWHLGSAAGVIGSVILETAFSVLLAPIYLYFYSKCVVLMVLGLRVDWKTQKRTGPDAWERRELMALLWDAAATSAIHREIWRAPEDQLHPWWRFAMHHSNEASASPARRVG